MLEFFDTKTALRIGLVLIVLGCAVMTHLIAGQIGNTTLKAMTKKVFIVFVVVFFLRVIAAYVDFRLAFEIGFFSSAVTYGFNLILLYWLFRIYWKLRTNDLELHKTDEAVILNPKYINKRRLSEILDEMFRELKINMSKTDELKSLVDGINKTR